MRELFVEELAQVTGGGHCPPHCFDVTTDACCEGCFDLCCVAQEIRELIDP